MEKKAEVDGKWLEVDANEVASRLEEIERSEILAIRLARLELGGTDKVAFAEKFTETLKRVSDEIDGMDDEQCSFYVLKKMLIS